ncbi:tyrosine-protein phosphatase [Ensifer soli]|uniref:tyrosine-protein phosphatase n=1 Tax=Ciceribacter sp. sgz301302 TaxID=3342379 RepID=UPI0035B9A0A5
MTFTFRIPHLLRDTRLRRTALWILAVLVFVPADHAVRLYSSGNFHTVVPGEVYRSAQLTPEALTAINKTYGIGTVLNLRGESRGAPWYDRELEATRALGIDHVDFGMSANRKLSQAEAQALIAVMRAAKKPLLIHCKAGADRTGLAAALYLAAIDGAGEEAAEGQISINYGHISLPYVGAYAMDETFEDMEPALGFPDS